MSELKSWVWPGVSGRRQIRFAILEGYCVAIAASALFAFSAIIALVGSYQIDALSIIMELAYAASSLAWHSESNVVRAPRRLPLCRSMF